MDKTKQKKRSKFLFILNTVMLVLLLAIGTVTVYGYWANRKVEEDKTVTIGHGDELVLIASTAIEDKLVPSGFAIGDQVEEIIYEYEVKWESIDNNDTQDRILSVIVNIRENPYDLVNIDVGINPSTKEIVLNGNKVVVTLTITLNEPENEIQYDAIKDKEIIFDIIFEVIPQITP